MSFDKKEAPMKIGYVRVSKHEQNEYLQIDALKKEGCEKWFTDKITGSKFERKGLDEALAYLRPGDTLVVWKLDRAGRSLKHLIELLSTLKEREIDFISLTENIDTTTPGGKLIFHVMGALAEFERDLIRERTNAGLEAARARGRKGGRPKAIQSPTKRAMMLNAYYEKKHTIDEICKTFHTSPSTLYRYIREDKAVQIAES
jgi:DNA invertase Pin-like site-specific DNA recombinase